MNNTRRKLIALGKFALLLGLLNAGSASAATVAPGTFTERYSVYRNGLLVDSASIESAPFPGVLELDFIDSNGAQIVGRSLTSNRPAADILMEVNYPGSSKSTPIYGTEAMAEVRYYFQVNYLGSGPAPVSSIPLVIDYALAANYNITSGDLSTLLVNTYFEGPGRSDNASFSFSTAVGGTVGKPRSGSVETIRSYNYDLSSANWGNNLRFIVRASSTASNFTTNSQAVSAEFQAVADPQVSFASGFEYADLFSIQVSENINAVPVPAAVYLFGFGLISLIGVARRKAKY